MSPRRRRWFRLLAASAGVGLSLLTVEAALRTTGATPFQPDPYLIVDVDPGPFFLPHPRYGYAPNPGAHTVTYTSHYTYTPTHTPDGRRATRPPDAHPSGPRWHIHGCSFTYGWSLQDPHTFPWRLQTALPHVQIENFGVAGYGTLHQLLQLRDTLDGPHPPDRVVVTYASLHDERNVLGRPFRKAIVPFDNQIHGLRYPAVTHWTDQRPHVTLRPLQYTPPPGIHRSALVQALDERANHWSLQRARPQHTSRKLLRAIAHRCAQHDIPLLVAGIHHDAPTRDTLAWCRDTLHLPTVDISVDLTLPHNNLLPIDWHPSPHANAHFADTLLAAFDQLGWTP